ncbi:tyrosine-type recombinase/integrase [Parahaliea mediterranea]|uniref:Tyrosine-type recombinase/integrase n=1 Tax=Parahaliea mediterranea TaxID=651086 RepID=A0A939IJK5_9GAMM|nr:integrase family protein [Parahaliea mediterranea]MBN7797759.1 tyrosine-type recombinase/integrase [Parahaliea mediterranea]
MAKLTKSSIDRLPLPPRKPDGTAQQAIHRDDALPGFGLRIGSGGAKTFFVEKRVNGRVKRISIGRYGHLTPTQARLKAQELLGSIAMGNDPAAEKRAKLAKSVTLEEAFEDYLATHRHLKPGTVHNYRKCIDGCLSTWKTRRLVDISKDMVEAKHRELGATAPARANNAMRVLRAVFNHAIAKYEDESGRPTLHFNPVDRLGKVRAWNPVKRRQTLIKPHQLAAWFDATLTLNEETTRDFFHFLLFTGLRKTEAATLEWSDIDFADKTITIADTKNRDPHVLPFSSMLQDLLERRRANGGAAWVFESPKFPGTPLKEPRSATAKVAKEWGYPFTPHDLRRTFITVAEGLDIPHYALKRLLNHRDTNDVTAGYIVSNVERLRAPMQKIADFLIQHIGPERLASEVAALPATPTREEPDGAALPTFTLVEDE